MHPKHSKVWSPVTALFLALAVGLAGCGSDSPTGTNGGGNGTGNGNGGNGTGEPGTNEVHVADNFFNPSSLTVDPGTTVTWTWVGGVPHNVIWQGADLSDGPLQSSGSHEVTMPQQAGTYNYTCTQHPGMDGTVTVQ